MRFIDIQPVNAELLKSHYVVFAFPGQELVQLCFKGFLGAFQLFDGKTLTAAGFDFRYTIGDFVNLFLKQTLLSLLRNRNTLELTVADYHSVIIPGRYPCTKLLAVSLFKVLLGGNKDVCRRIEAKELRRPLFCEVVWNNKEAFLA